MVDPKRRRKVTKGAAERDITRIYHHYNRQKEKVKVCQRLLLTTLGYSSNRIIISTLEKAAGKIYPSPDKRGKHDPHNKFTSDQVTSIRHHIMLFNPCITHYRRKHAPNRLYISPLYSTSQLLKDYNENHTAKVSRSRYYKEIKDMNIGFVKLGEEECEACDLHDNHLKEKHGLHEEKDRRRIVDPNSKKQEKLFFQGCKPCEEYTKHVSFANQSRIGYRNDRDREWDDEIIVSADLQKVIMLPVMPGLKKVIFCKRIVMFNETFAPLGGEKNHGKATGVLWHEGISGRTAEDVASVFISFLRTVQDVKSITIWSDNCSTQGENWWFFTALAAAVNRPDSNFLTIRCKYFEPGHTFMPADSFHHLIEQGLKNAGKVQNFSDFVNIVEKYGKAHVMRIDDFLSIPRGVSNGAFAKSKPHLEDVRIMEFRRGSFRLYWKTTHIQKNYSSLIRVSAAKS